MDRHAYLILAHKNPGQVRKLISLLDDARNDVFVHIDASASFGPDALDGICKQSCLYFTGRRITVHWGGVSIMRAELELLKKAIATGRYSYFHLLSGQDLPIKDQDTIHAFFKEHAGREFIHLWKFKPHTHRRFHYYTLFPEGAGFFLTNILNGAFKGILMGLGIQINKDVDFRFGAQWFSITEKLAKYTVSKEEWLEKVFRHTNTVDEIFLPTLVWNSEFRQRLYDSDEHEENTEIFSTGNMRFIDWTRGESIRHPWTFTEDDWNLLHEVPHFWARKFDENIDNAIIDRLAAELGGKAVE